MRALVVCAAASPGTPALVERLSASADLVVGVDAGAGVCLAAKVLPDVVIGDLDSLSPDDEATLRSAGARFIVHPAEKDESDLELALRLCEAEGVDAVVVTAASGGRLDHTLAGLASLSAHAALHPVLVEPDMTAWVLAPDARERVEVAGSGTVFSVMVLGESATVSVSGARWPLLKRRLRSDETLGLSNAVEGESATVVVHEGHALVVVPGVVHGGV